MTRAQARIHRISFELPQRPETRAQLFNEELRLFPRRKVVWVRMGSLHATNLLTL
jgi:hypothetical protein